MTDFEKRWRQAQEKCDVYVMCSTLNQIVNYLPLENLKNRESKSLEIINLTYEDGENKRFLNKMWDENFSTVYNDRYEERPWIDSDDIKLPRRFKCENYIREIDKCIDDRKNKNFIWNVTGGQRNILFTALKYIEDNADTSSNHTVMYLEGNTQKITVGYYDRNEWKFGAVNNSYRSDTIDLHNLFRLAGYESKISNAVSMNKDKNEEKFLDLLKAYSNFYSKLYEVNEEVRKKLIESNKWNNNEDNSNDFFELLDCINCEEKVTVGDIEKIKDSLNNRSIYLFGYFLEYMAAAVIWNAVKEMSKQDADFFQSLSHSVKVRKHDWKEKEKFCELDLVLLLRSGQTVVFECKSGFMSAENAKSREYTAYALGGVYGKPILITPLSKREAIEGVKSDVYENITKAYSSARRAGLEVFHLDTLKEDLKDLFKDAL